ncbi:MAG: AMP-binding protein [bacterium]|nr:AMP-binding protein [bacterium]
MQTIPIAYKPSNDIIINSNITKILNKFNLSYEEFLDKSIKEPEWFWTEFFNDINFKWLKFPDKIVEFKEKLYDTKWFINGKLNISLNCLDNSNKENLSVIEVDENSNEYKLTYKELEEKVNKLSNFLANNGVKENDVVALFMPLSLESVLSILALSRIGAIILPLFSGFGSDAVNLRLKISNAKYIISYKHNIRRNKLINMEEILFKSLNETEIKKIFLINKYNINDNFNLKNIKNIEIIDFNQYEKSLPYITIPEFDSYKELMIIYTSGTTGKPKGIVHYHSGFPIKSAQDMYHIFDIKPNDIITWITDIGWMMGPWLIFGALINKATIFIYNGSPDYPNIDIIWELTKKYNVNIVGLSPSYIRAISNKSNVNKMELPSLKAIGSTGEVWDYNSWIWTFNNICKNKIPIINYSGGTEISGGILGNVNIKDIKPLSFNTMVPGIYADVLDENGNSIVNEEGYLVIKNHNPGLAKTFLNEHEKYLQTYWSKYDNIWYHGDLAYKDNEGFFFILGRADDTLKIAGKRIGPAEYETILNEHKDVKESAVVGVPDELKGNVPVAFITLKNEIKDELSLNELKKELFNSIIDKLGKPFALKEIYIVKDIPKTRNAKIMRRILRDILIYKEVKGDVSNLVNPEIIQDIINSISFKT